MRRDFTCILDGFGQDMWVEFKESVLEIMFIIKTIFTTIWFWVPVLFSGVIYLQLWMMFFIHPLTIVIVPSILLVYMIFDEERRIRAQYGLQEVKRFRGFHLFGPETVEKGFKWDQEKAIEEYEKMAKKKQQSEQKEDSS